MIPEKFGAEYFKPPAEFGNGQLLCITYGPTMEQFVHVDGLLDDKVLYAPDRAIKRHIIRPMLEQMNRKIQLRDRQRALLKAQPALEAPAAP